MAGYVTDSPGAQDTVRRYQAQQDADAKRKGMLGGTSVKSFMDTAGVPGFFGPGGPSTAGPGSPVTPWTAAGGSAGTPASGTSALAHVADPNAVPGSDAALLRAKERQGQIGRSAVTGLHEALGARGVLGSGIEGQGTADIAGQALSGISDVNREQQIQDVETARHMAELKYQGGITQRGQDIGANTAERGFALGARGQDINAAIARSGQSQAAYMAMLQAALAALKLGSSGGGYTAGSY